MTTPYRTTCPDCAPLRVENDRLRSTAKKEVVERWLWRTGNMAMCVAIGGIVTLLAAYVHGLALRPEPPETCRETAEIITVNGTTRVCSIGGTMTTEVLPKADGNQQVLVRCRCQTEQRDAGGHYEHD